MRSGNRVVGPDTPLPARVHRRHEHPSTSDNFGAIDRASHEPIGPDGLITNDCNGQAWWAPLRRRYVVFGMHWRRPDWNGYTRIRRIHGIGTRPMTPRELRKENWTAGQVKRWRRPNGERPRTARELYAYGVRRGSIQIIELKASAFALLVVMQSLVADARATGHPAWYMVLDDMAPRHKVEATKKAGGQIAIIAGTDGLHLPPTYREWSTHPDRIWG